MRIAITGSHGLIGTALVRSLVADGHEVVRVARSGDGPDVVRWDLDAGTIDGPGLEGLDGVVHLAGEPIASRPWTEGHRRRVLQSRTRGTSLLSEALASLAAPPPVLVSGSAVGFYGDRGDEVLTETSPPGTGFVSDVCTAWEAATGLAEAVGVRVVHARSGVVLSREGGAFPALLRPFRLGVGGPAGDGHQWFSWITLDDEVAALRFLLDHDVAGPVNLTAPRPVTNGELTAALGRVLHRPTVLRVPRLVTHLPFGVGDLLGGMLFDGARVEPAVLTAEGFAFGDEDLEPALRALLAR